MYINCHCPLLSVHYLQYFGIPPCSLALWFRYFLHLSCTVPPSTSPFSNTKNGPLDRFYWLNTRPRVEPRRLVSTSLSPPRSWAFQCDHRSPMACRGRVELVLTLPCEEWIWYYWGNHSQNCRRCHHQGVQIIESPTRDQLVSITAVSEKKNLTRSPNDQFPGHFWIFYSLDY